DPTLPPQQRFSIAYLYNERGLLKSVPGFANQITYHPSGQTESLLYANGVLTTKTYDIRHRLDVLKTTQPSSPTPAILQQLQYGYDKVSNVLSITDQRSGVTGEPSSTECFVYDDLHRLLHVNGRCQEAYHIDFTYSATGNITSKTSDRP